MGITIAEKTVHNYMREMKIKSRLSSLLLKLQQTLTLIATLKIFSKNNLTQKKPNAIWCSDITYIYAKEEFAYLTSIMDLF